MVRRLTLSSCVAPSSLSSFDHSRNANNNGVIDGVHAFISQSEIRGRDGGPRLHTGLIRLYYSDMCRRFQSTRREKDCKIRLDDSRKSAPLLEAEGLFAIPLDPLGVRGGLFYAGRYNRA